MYSHESRRTGKAVVFAGAVLATLAGSALAQSQGPDVIVGDLSDMGNYGSYDYDGAGPQPRIYAYSVGTTSCNIGTQALDWYTTGTSGGSNLPSHHPVIGQNMYRFRPTVLRDSGGNALGTANTFEQIGQSWLKHGYTALTQSLCGTCNGQGGNVLGPGCSDPYVASLNGSQSRLGPRYQVNGYNGNFPYPTGIPNLPTNPAPVDAAVLRRLQIQAPDLDAALNAGAVYFAEGQYVTQDDQAAFTAGVNNGLNNTSYRRASFNTGTYVFSFSAAVGTTQRQKSALWAWKALDPAVVISNIDVPGEGRFEMASKVTDLGNGLWAYEYLVRNNMSDRSGASFQINIASTGCVTTPYNAFRDVRYHSGETQNNIPWAFTSTSDGLRWACTETFAQNPNANALRFATAYNFRVVTNRAPAAGTVTLGLFKPGTPSSVTVAAQVPSSCPTPVCDSLDFNQDGDFPTPLDLEDFIAANAGNICSTCSTDLDFNNDGDFPTPLDIEAFISVNAGGPCL